MYRPPPNNQQYYSAPPTQVPAQPQWSATGAQFQQYPGSTANQGVYSGGMHGFRQTSQMPAQQSPGLHVHGQVQGAGFQQVRGPLPPQQQAYPFQQAYTAPFQQTPTSPFRQPQGPMFQQPQTVQFQQTQRPVFQQAQLSPFQQIQGQPAQQTAGLQGFVAQSQGTQPMRQAPPFPQGQPVPPSSYDLKKKEKERLFREQQERLKFTAITKTAKNPLDNLFGSQSVSQVTQGTKSTHVVQSLPSDDRLSGADVEVTAEQLATSHQPVEATVTLEPSKPSGREVLEKLLAESLDDLSQNSPSTKKRAQFKPTKAMFARPASKATFVQSTKARLWEHNEQFTGVFAEQAEDDFGEFSSADPGLATVQEPPLQQGHDVSVHGEQQPLSTPRNEVSQFATTSAEHLHFPTEQTFAKHFPLPTQQPQNPTGQLQLPSGQPQLPSGQPQFPAGQPQFPTGQSQFPAGQSQLPTVQPQFPTGQSQFPAGQLQFPAGQLQFPAGQSQFPAGQSQLPTGQPQFPVGPSQFPAGQCQFPVGQPQFPAGQPQFPAGQPQLSAALHQFPTSSAGPPCTTGPGITPLLASTAAGSTFGTTATNLQQPQVVQSMHPVPSLGQHSSAMPLKNTRVQTGMELRQLTEPSTSHQEDWGSFTSFQDKPSVIAATCSNSEGAQKDPSTCEASIGVSDRASAPSVPGSWISSFSTLPPVYHDVHRMASLSDSIFLNTKTLSTIFASSGVPRPVLKDIWNEVSQTYRGKLVQDEMVMALALIALAQGGVKELKREALLNLPLAPVPQLSAVQPAGLSVAASKGGSVQSHQPPCSDHPATVQQLAVQVDSDDFGAFQASSSFPVQKEIAATGEQSHLLQPVQSQKPPLLPGLITTPPIAADSLHTAVAVPSSSTDWTTNDPQGNQAPAQMVMSAGDSAWVAASPVPLIPSEADQSSGDRYAAFRDLSVSVVDANAPVVESTSKTEGELLGVSQYVAEEHKEQTAEATGLFSEPYKLEQCLKVCHSLLQAALEAMTSAPPAALDEVLATSHGQEKIKGLYEVFKLAERVCDSGSIVDNSRLPAIRKQWTQLIGLNPEIALMTSASHQPLPLPAQDNSCAICKSQGPLPCVPNTVEVGGATCHVTCINFWYTFMSE